MRAILATILFLALSIDALAANKYVRPNGGTYGTENGSDWTNAFDGFTGINWASVSCGDTIWVAGGTYTQDFTPQKDCTVGSQLYIRRARTDATEVTGAAGYSSGFASTVEMRSATLSFGSYDYITVSGRTTAAGGSHGWLINFPTGTSGIGIDWPNGSTGSFITVEYMDVQGPDILGFTGDGRGVDDTAFAGATDHTFSHMKISGWESGLYIVGTDNHVSEYIELYHIQSDGFMHPNLYYILDSANGVIRYGNFHHSCASGVGIGFSDGGPWDNWKVHGNVFHHMMGTNDGGSDCTGYGYALGVQDATITNLKIMNNTFYNVANYLNLSLASCGTGSETRNNLSYGGASIDTCGTTSNSINASSNPFVSSATDDYHIISTVAAAMPKDKGTNIGSPYNVDGDGVTRGADGTWDVGAFEYAAGGGSASHAISGSVALSGGVVMQ